jgi:predicted amidohydrolase
VLANQCGTNATSELLGASRVIAPDGSIEAQASRIGEVGAGQPEVVLVRLTERAAYQDVRAFAAALRA